jgi:hypothetical protein
VDKTVPRRRFCNTSQFILHTSHFIIHNSYLIIPCALFLGCGVAGPPHPPRVERPEPVTDLTAAQKGPAFELSFTRPRRAVDGQRLTKPLEIEIIRAVSPSGGAAPPSLEGAAPWFTVSADDVAKHAAGDKVTFDAKLSEAEIASSVGATFSLAVRGRTFGFRHRVLESESSNVVRAVFLDVSGPPESLQVKTTEKALELSWTAPQRSLSGKPLSGLAGYRVYRSLGKPTAFQLRGETVSPALSDSEFAFDHTYFFKVCAWFKQGAQVAESQDSAVVEITPRDTFPPAAPQNVSGLFSADAVQLVWTTNTEPDLAGYNVYRREGDAAWRKMNPDLLRTPTFEDRAVQPGHSYVYRVTAVDLAHNESAPSDEIAVEAR